MCDTLLLDLGPPLFRAITSMTATAAAAPIDVGLFQCLGPLSAGCICLLAGGRRGSNWDAHFNSHTFQTIISSTPTRRAPLISTMHQHSILQLIVLPNTLPQALHSPAAPCRASFSHSPIVWWWALGFVGRVCGRVGTYPPIDRAVRLWPRVSDDMMSVAVSKHSATVVTEAVWPIRALWPSIKTPPPDGPCPHPRHPRHGAETTAMPSGWAGLAASVLRGGQQQQQQPAPPEQGQRDERLAPVPPPSPPGFGAEPAPMMGEVGPSVH